MGDPITATTDNSVPLDDVEDELDVRGREACSGRWAFGATLSPQMMDALRERLAISGANRPA